MTHDPLAENQTGILANPEGAEEMCEAAAIFPPTSTGSKFVADAVRILYTRAVDEPQLGLGSVPDPIYPTAAAEAAAQGLLGNQPLLYFNLLGARMTFERIGVRLYEVLISKHEAFGSYAGGPSREALMDILNEEHRHFAMLEALISKLGGDPTAITPAADIVGILGTGILSVLADPRTTLVQCLEAILVAEMADENGWSELVAIARTAQNNQLVPVFQAAERVEEQHVAQVKAWIAAAHGLQRPPT